MAKCFIEDTTLTAIGNAIRAKSGKADLMLPSAMPAAIEGIISGGGSGSYVWTKQGMSETVTEDTTGGTYTLTTPNDSRPSSEIEICTAAPVYDSSKRQWNFDSTLGGYMKVTVSNEDSVLPPIGVGPWPSEIYVRVTSEPNIWYLVTEFGVGDSSPYLKTMTYSKKFTSDVDWAKKYLTDADEDAYPVDGWSLDGYYYRRVISDPNRTGGGKTWILSNVADETYTVTYGNGLFVSGTANTGLYYSTNGITWTQSNITDDFINKVFYDDIRNLFIAIGDAGIYYSSDGLNWINSGTKDSFNTAGTNFAYNNNCIIVAGKYSLYYSTDGKTWTKSNITSPSTITCNSIKYANGIWVTSIGSGYTDSSRGLYYSTDGKVWTKVSNLNGGSVYDVLYGNGIWVVASYVSNNTGLYYSTNGITWTQSNITAGCIGVSYYNGIFHAWTNGGSLYYSTDGKEWTRCTGSIYVTRMYYFNGMWLLTDSSMNNSVYYSTDGVTWTKSNITGISCLYIYYTNGVYVLTTVSSGLYYSTDGITWTQSNITAGKFYEVIFHNGVLVSCCISSGYTGVYYSEGNLIEVDF